MKASKKEGVGEPPLSLKNNTGIGRKSIVASAADSYVNPLFMQTKAAARQIGAVSVYTGETVGKVPLAAGFIARMGHREAGEEAEEPTVLRNAAAQMRSRDL
jgi:hypothetical protein